MPSAIESGCRIARQVKDRHAKDTRKRANSNRLFQERVTSRFRYVGYAGRTRKEIGRAPANSTVMARLDRAIHERCKIFSSLMDGRVKPGHDNRAEAIFQMLRPASRSG
jgi:hypothetical protein